MASMTTLTAEEAQRDFDNLLDRVAQGEAITITRNGKAVALLALWPQARSAQQQADAPPESGS